MDYPAARAIPRGVLAIRVKIRTMLLVRFPKGVYGTYGTSQVEPASLMHVMHSP